MADPLPRPGSILLGNTAQVAVDTDGYVVLHDPDYLLLETGTTDAMLLETGTTDGLLLEPYDCVCCVEGLCGECTAAIVGDVTLDLGVTGWTGNDNVYYDNCEAACVDLTGEVVLTQGRLALATPEPDVCEWYYIFDPFCNWGANDQKYKLAFQLAIGWRPATGWFFYLWVVCYFYSTFGTSLHYRPMRRLKYEGVTTTTCAGLHTLSKVSDDSFSWFGFSTQPCTSGSSWDWPATVEIDVP